MWWKVSSTKNTCQVQLIGIKCLEITWLLVYTIYPTIPLHFNLKNCLLKYLVDLLPLEKYREGAMIPVTGKKKKLSSSGVTQGRNSEEAFSVWAFLGLFCFCGAWRSMLAFLSLTLVLIRGHLTRLLSNASICYDVISPASTTGTRKDYTNSLIIYRVKLVDADMRWAVAGADMMKGMKMKKWYLDSPLYVSSKTVIE